MQELAHVIFRSPFVSICDVCCPTAFGEGAYLPERGSMVFIRSGFFAARVGERSLPIDSNYAIWCGDGDALSAMPSSKTACTCTVIRYSETALPKACSSTNVLLCGPAVYLKHARLLNAARLAQADTTVNDAATALLAEIDASQREPSLSSEHPRPVPEIKELLNQSLTKRISLPELADRFYLSPFTISRCFHKETGLSLRHYIQRLRLRRALTFMLDEKRSLTAIALELGFYDESHFSKAFHAEFGTTPALALKAS